MNKTILFYKVAYKKGYDGFDVRDDKIIRKLSINTKYCKTFDLNDARLIDKDVDYIKRV